jgi:maltose/moltooligosaccharide transporter
MRAVIDRGHQMKQDVAPQGTQSKPQLSFWQIWNMCFGFLGIQFGFALQNANVSRIFQTLGADMETLPGLWIAAPPDRADRAADRGLPLGSHLDGTGPAASVLHGRGGSRLGRAAAVSERVGAVDGGGPAVDAGRVDQHLDGAVPRLRRRPVAGTAARQRLCDAELLHRRGRGGGEPAAVVAGEVRRVEYRRPGEVPDTVRYAFYAGGAVLLLAIAWTVLRTREYPPEKLHAWDEAPALARRPRDAARVRRNALAWLLAGSIGVIAVALGGWDRQLYIFAGLLTAYGVALLLRSLRLREAPSPTSWTTSTTCRRRCGSSAWCSSSPGSRCSRCGSTPPAR